MNYNRSFLILILAGTTVAIPTALAMDADGYKDKTEDPKVDKTDTDHSDDNFFTSGNTDTNNPSWRLPDGIKKYLINNRSHRDQRDPVVIMTSSGSESVTTAELVRVKSVNSTNFGAVPLKNNFALFGKVAFSAEGADGLPKATFGEISESEKNDTEMTFVVGAKYNF